LSSRASSAALWTLLPLNTASLQSLCGAGAPARIFAATRHPRLETSKDSSCHELQALDLSLNNCLTSDMRAGAPAPHKNLETRDPRPGTWEGSQPRTLLRLTSH